MPEVHLKQPGDIYSACQPLKKNKERYKNSKKQKTLDTSITIN